MGRTARSVGPSKAFYDNDVSNTKVTAVIGGCIIDYYNIYNASNAAAFLQFYDALAANVTVGTTLPTNVLAIPQSAVLDTQRTMKWRYETGCVIAMTTTQQGNGAPSAASQVEIEYVPF
jgi:hypothetical protein